MAAQTKVLGVLTAAKLPLMVDVDTLQRHQLLQFQNGAIRANHQKAAESARLFIWVVVLQVKVSERWQMVCAHQTAFAELPRAEGGE